MHDICRPCTLHQQILYITFAGTVHYICRPSAIHVQALVNYICRSCTLHLQALCSSYEGPVHYLCRPCALHLQVLCTTCTGGYPSSRRMPRARISIAALGFLAPWTERATFSAADAAIVDPSKHGRTVRLSHWRFSASGQRRHRMGMRGEGCRPVIL